MKDGWSLRRFKNRATYLIKDFFGLLGIGLTSHANLTNLREKADLVGRRDVIKDQSHLDLQFIKSIETTKYEALIKLLSKSKSQLRQDLFVISETDFKSEGFFVEFGATNGVDLNNTHLLEMEFSWKGILAEPARVWKKELHKNRPNCAIENLCVWRDSNSKLTFNETNVPELSTINFFSQSDDHGKIRQSGRKYIVDTISLLDLLDKHNAPRFIDYLSIDTEGSEFEILNAFDFDKYTFGIITVEHNDSPQREMIFRLLSKHGYKRRYTDISYFDDWYTK